MIFQWSSYLLETNSSACAGVRVGTWCLLSTRQWHRTKLDSAPWPHSCWIHFPDAKRKVIVSAETFHEDPVLDTERTQASGAIATTPTWLYRNPLMSVKAPPLPHQLKMLCLTLRLHLPVMIHWAGLWNPALLSVPKLSHIPRQASLKFSWMRPIGSKTGKNKISQSKNQRWRQRQQNRRDLQRRRKKWVGSGCKAVAGPPDLFLKLQTGSAAQQANSNILERHSPPDSLSQTLSPPLERNPPSSWVIATVSLHSSLRNLRVTITSTHLSNYFIQVAIISCFKERKKTKKSAHFRKYVIWDVQRVTNVSGLKSDMSTSLAPISWKFDKR